MNKFFPLLVCLSLSIFTVARATKSAHAFAPDTRSAQENPTGQEEDEKTSLNDANNDSDVPSNDDDSMPGASENEDENVNNDDGGNAPGDQEAGDNDPGDDDEGDDGGGDEGE